MNKTMFAVLALAGDLGCSLGPWLSGIVTDLAGTAWGFGEAAEGAAMKSGMLAASLFPLIMVVSLMAYLLRERRRKKLSAE